MIKRFIIALLCFVVLATAWEAESCDSKTMKEAIAVGYFHHTFYYIGG